MGSKPIIVAAIDIGNEESGYAFSFIIEPNNIFMNKNWESAPKVGYKTQTCVLSGPQGEMVAFGDVAENSYEDCTKNGQGEHHLFKSFLSDLSDTKLVPRSTTATDGTEAPLIDVISMCLKSMKCDLMVGVKRNLGENSSISDDLIRWVVTVPASWSDYGRQLLKEAAIRDYTTEALLMTFGAGIGHRTIMNPLNFGGTYSSAGFVHSSDDTHGITVIEEPLATAVYCRQLPASNFICTGSLVENPLLGEEDVLVVHSGETLFQVTCFTCKTQKVNIVAKAMGKMGSSKSVQEEFIDVLSTVFGSDFIKAYFDECPDLRVMWKEIFAPFTAKEVKFAVPYRFSHKCQEMTGVSIEEAVQRGRHQGISFAHGFLLFSKEAVAAIIDPILNGCVTTIRQQLKGSLSKSMTYIVLTGQLSSLLYFREQLGEMLGEEYKVLVPCDDSIASLRGAVLYGHNLVTANKWHVENKAVIKEVSREQNLAEESGFAGKAEQGRIDHFSIVLAALASLIALWWVAVF